MTEARQKILDTIDANRDKAIKFLQEIVAIPSVTGDEGKIQTFLADYLKKVGLDVDMWESSWDELKKHPGYIPVAQGYEGRPNIVAKWTGSGGGRSLLLNGHTDVIPVGNGEGWSDNPWSAKIKEGKIYADPIQFPDQMGVEIVASIIQHSKGETLPPQKLIPTRLYRKADAEADPQLK